MLGHSSSSGSLIKVGYLASGGMGRVEVVMRREGNFERLYAVKRLHAHLREDAQLRAMFLDEARIAGLLRHTNIVSVLDVGEDEDGPFLVMDLVEGLSLAQIISHHADDGDLLPIQLCAEIGEQIARGLHAAHELSGPDDSPLHLVHRDVSPHNVLVGYDGVVRVTDFGIAKALGQSSRTATGVIKGKLGYVSPEQARYEKLDRRSDLFSLGVVVFELVTAQRLYKNKSEMDGMRRLLSAPPPDIGEYRHDAPPELVELVMQLLAKDRNERPETALDVAERLQQISVDAVEGSAPLSLSSYMTAEFAGVRQEQRERLMQSREEALSGLASSKEVPQATSASGDSSSSRRWLIVAAALVLLVPVAVYGAMQLGTRAKPIAASEPLPAETTPSPAPPVAPSSNFVTLSVESQPSGAELWLGTEPRGRTPTKLKVRRGQRRLTLRVTHSGFVASSEEVIPGADQELSFTLKPLAKPRAPKPRAAPTKPAPAPSAKKGKDYYRYD